MSEKDRELLAIICKYATMRGIEQKNMGLVMGISQPTFYRRWKDQDALTLREIRSACRCLKIPADEIGQALI